MTAYPAISQGSEHEHQSSLFEWIELRALSDERFAAIYAVPNGFKGDSDKRKAAAAARWLLDEGMQPGVPDICVPVPILYVGETVYDEGVEQMLYPGLYIEMKAPYRRSKTGKGKGGVEPEQEKWIERLRKLGHRVEVCYSEAEARAVICDYLGVKE